MCNCCYGAKCLFNIYSVCGALVMRCTRVAPRLQHELDTMRVSGHQGDRWGVCVSLLRALH